MIHWFNRHRVPLHWAILGLGALWAIAAATEGRPGGAVAGACVALGQAAMLFDARKVRPGGTAPAGRWLVFGLITAAVASIGSVALILLTD